VSADDASSADAKARLARLRRARARLRAADPVLRRLIDADPRLDPRAWLQEMPEMDAFGVLIFQVVGQQLSVAATRHLLERIRVLFAGHLPSPREVLDAPERSLHDTGLSRRKAATIRAIAEEFASHRIDERKLRAMSDEEIERVLTQVPGVGPWTVHGFLIIALDRQDVVLPGDLALRKAIARNYRLDRLPSAEEVLGIAERWRPYRSLATAYLFASAFGTPPDATA